MKKTVPIISYLIYLALGAYLVISSKLDLNAIQNTSADSFAEGLANGLGGIGLAIVMILGLIYSAAALVALILKLVHNASGWLLFGLLSVIFDLAFTALHGYCLISQVSGGSEIQNFLIFGALCVVSVASLIASCSSLSNK